MSKTLYHREPLELDYDKKPLLCSKDDTDMPDFIPITCPICFEIIWDSKNQINSCKICQTKMCKICLNKMKKTRSLYNTDSNNRKYLPCPFCREKKYNNPPIDDIENQVSASPLTATSNMHITQQNRRVRRYNICEKVRYISIIIIICVVAYIMLIYKQ